jgi:hypothetical protein
MARGRMLDRSIKLSKKIANTSMAGQWLYFRMLPFTDDHGKTFGDVEDIRAEILPKEKITDKKISSLLSELHNNELILWADGEVSQFVDWNEHQSLKGRPANSQFPDYQEVTGKGQKRLEKVEKETDENDSLSSSSTSLVVNIYKDIQGLILTKEDFDSLVSKYSEQEVLDIIEAMENYKGLSKKYVSAYRTAGNWIKLRRDKNQSATPVISTLE